MDETRYQKASIGMDVDGLQDDLDNKIAVAVDGEDRIATSVY